MRAPALILSFIFFTHASSAAAGEIQEIMSPGPGFIDLNASIGTFGIPSQVQHITRSRDGRLLYRMTLSTDRYGRRVTPQPSGPKTKSFLAFGNSIIFGDGLNDDQTLPSSFARFAPDTRVYNYAFLAHGPHHLYAHSVKRRFDNGEVEPAAGWIAYFLLNYDLSRMVNDSRSAEYSGLAPYVFLDEQDRIQWKDSFQNGQPLRTWLYSWLHRQWIVRKWNENFPRHEIYFPKVTGEHVHLLCRAFEEARNNFKRSLPEMEFLVVLHPIGDFIPESIGDCLGPKGIRVLDYRRLFTGIPRETLYLQDDVHLTQFGHEIVAKRLAHDLGYPQANP